MLPFVDLKRDRFRTLLLVIAIASSISLAFTLVSLGNGVRSSARESLDRIEADVYVLPEGLNPLFRDLQRFDQAYAVIEGLEGSPFEISRYTPRLKDSLFLTLDRPLEVMTTGVVPGTEEGFGQYETVDGSWFPTRTDPVREKERSGGDPGISDITGECMVSASLAEAFGIRQGDILPISSSPGNEPVEYEVVGIFLDRVSGRSEEILVHLGELQLFKGLLDKDTVSEVLLDVDDPDGLLEWSEGDLFRYKDIVDLHTRDGVLDEIYQFTRIVDAFSIMVISITVLVSCAFVSTVMMITARQRSREHAVLRAIGMSRTSIGIHFLIGSLSLSVMGGVLGVSFGIAICHLLNEASTVALDSLPAYFELFDMGSSTLVVVLGLTLLTGMTSGLVPALISTLRPPARVLRGDI